MGRLVMLACALLAACASSGAPPHAPSTPARTPTSRPAAVPFVVRQPVGLAYAAGLVWAVSSYDGAVVALDARTGAVAHRVAVGDTPLRIVADGALVWVTVFGAGRVVGIDAATGTIAHTVALDGQPEGIAAGFGSLWVVRQQARLLTRLSSTGRVGASYRLGAQPRLVTSTARYVFASDYSGGTITRLDPRTGTRTTSARLCAGAQGLAATGSTVWVTCTPAGALLAVDEHTLRVTGRLAIDGEPDAVHADGARLLVAATKGPTLYEVRPDPRHPAVLRSRSLGEAFALNDRANVDLVVAGGRTLVSSFGSDRILVAPG